MQLLCLSPANSSLFLHRNRAFPLPNKTSRPRKRATLRSRAMVMQAQRDLMKDLLGKIEEKLDDQLSKSLVPEDVRAFQNGDNSGALDIRSGSQVSAVDFILESWLHCKLPMGSLNITTISAFLNASTDAPHLLMEFIQSSPSSLILIIDLLPRRDLVLYTDYLKEFYEDTNLDKQRQELEKLPQVQPYCSPSLFVRSAISPTAIATRIDCGTDGENIMEEIMSGALNNVAKEIVGIWLDKCAASSKELDETERAELVQRDKVIKNKTIEIDLTANLPRLFGQEIANKVVETIQKAYRV